MKLLVIRHAIAMEREDFAGSDKSDDLRPLTVEGRDKMARNAKGLRALVKRVDVLATSPLLRARQTAEIVAREYRVTNIETTDTLEPEAPLARFAEWLAPHVEAKLVAIVGHEPHLGILVTWLTTGVDDSAIELKKGAACLLSFSGRDPGPASATLNWLVTPRQLGRFGR